MSTRQGSIWDYGDPTLPPGTLPKKAASNSGGGSGECPRLSVNIGGARSRDEQFSNLRIDWMCGYVYSVESKITVLKLKINI